MAHLREFSGCWLDLSKQPYETNRYKAVLDEAQFHPFIKKY